MRRLTSGSDRCVRYGLVRVVSELEEVSLCVVDRFAGLISNDHCDLSVRVVRCVRVETTQ
jgi:hypothetical protein